MADGLADVDWQQPWLAPWRATGEAVARHACQGLAVCDALNVANTPSSAPVRFVPQSALPAGMAYERYIFESGCCPTREGLHDFFNGLCWLHFPRTKQKLNQLQAAHIAQSGIQPVRGPARDAITVFDENAALLQAPPALCEALLAKDWQRLFITQRPLWAQARLVLFGHALLEKLVAPRKPITAHVYIVNVAMNSVASIAELDAWLAADLSAEKLASKPFAHLPVLGVPGWWPANEVPEFYDDVTVFRLPQPKGQSNGSAPLQKENSP